MSLTVLVGTFSLLSPPASLHLSHDFQKDWAWQEAGESEDNKEDRGSRRQAVRGGFS